VNPEPVIVTLVPPCGTPALGSTDETAGGPAATEADAIVKAFWVQSRAPVEPIPPPIVALRIAVVVMATDTDVAPGLAVKVTGDVVPVMTTPVVIEEGPKAKVTGTVEGEAPVTAREVA
jgi:hypothetical protein